MRRAGVDLRDVTTEELRIGFVPLGPLVDFTEVERLQVAREGLADKIREIPHLYNEEKKAVEFLILEPGTIVHMLSRFGLLIQRVFVRSDSEGAISNLRKTFSDALK